MEESAYSEKNEKLYKKNINKLYSFDNKKLVKNLKRECDNTILMFNNPKNIKMPSIPKKTKNL